MTGVRRLVYQADLGERSALTRIWPEGGDYHQEAQTVRRLRSGNHFAGPFADGVVVFDNALIVTHLVSDAHAEWKDRVHCVDEFLRRLPPG